MKVSIDNIQRIKGTGIFMLEFYKILMGTFLTVFVPRQCGNDVCSINDNIYDDGLYHRIILIFNGVSFLIFMMLYYNEIKRENWCITYLDIDDNKSLDNLDNEIEEYPNIKSNMVKLNKRYKFFSILTLISQFFNIILSSIDIIDNHAGAATLTPMLSYIILILIKLYNSMFISYSSLINERAYSAYLKGPKTYNSIDLDHIKQDEVFDLDV